VISELDKAHPQPGKNGRVINTALTITSQFCRLKPDAWQPGDEAHVRINERPGAGAVSGATGAGRTAAAGTRFTLGDAAGTNRPSGMQAAAPAGALDGLLALQAAGDVVERRKKAMRRGHGILDSLDRLKIGMLSGDVSAAQLQGLRQQLKQQRDAADDPALDELLAHVDLRAEVELAKMARR
jgi:Class II flagellar assembly regulator